MEVYIRNSMLFYILTNVKCGFYEEKTSTCFTVSRAYIGRNYKLKIILPHYSVILSYKLYSLHFHVEQEVL